jgi:Contractile injection system tube protein
MAFPDLFKLEKLKIEAYSNRERTAKIGEFEAMFNPTTLNQTFGVEYEAASDVAGASHQARFVRKKPASLAVKLLLDGTGVDRMGLLTLFGSNRTVGQRIGDFLGLAYQVNGDTHEPSFLWVKWGDWGTELGRTGYKCRLKSVAIAYQSFNRDGSPMRAELDIALAADDDLQSQLTVTGRSSPDVTHSRLARAGDTLPSLTREVYGSPRHVAAVARINDLDQLRVIEPGRDLIFPPITG